MEPQSISQSFTVSEILQKYPETSRVFIEEKTACIGCYMARFCNLKDVARVYGLETETFIREMQQVAINKINQNSKE